MDHGGGDALGVDLVGEVLSLSDVRYIGVSYKKNVVLFTAAGFALAFACCTAIEVLRANKQSADEKSREQVQE